MEKVRQVGENYELNKYKTLNRTVELDARLANERLLATKLRLNQVNSMNEKLSKQLRMAQQQYRNQEKKLLLTETMLRQLVESRDSHHGRRHDVSSGQAGASPKRGSALSRLRIRPQVRPSPVPTPEPVAPSQPPTVQSTRMEPEARQIEALALEGLRRTDASSPRQPEVRVSNMSTQTQTSRTKMIINDLRQRLNLVGSRGECHHSDYAPYARATIA